MRNYYRLITSLGLSNLLDVFHDEHDAVHQEHQEAEEPEHGQLPLPPRQFCLRVVRDRCLRTQSSRRGKDVSVILLIQSLVERVQVRVCLVKFNSQLVFWRKKKK